MTDESDSKKILTAESWHRLEPLFRLALKHNTDFRPFRLNVQVDKTIVPGTRLLVTRVPNDEAWRLSGLDLDDVHRKFPELFKAIVLVVSVLNTEQASRLDACVASLKLLSGWVSEEAIAYLAQNLYMFVISVCRDSKEQPADVMTTLLPLFVRHKILRKYVDGTPMELQFRPESLCILWERVSRRWIRCISDAVPNPELGYDYFLLPALEHAEDNEQSKSIRCILNTELTRTKGEKGVHPDNESQLYLPNSNSRSRGRILRRSKFAAMPNLRWEDITMEFISDDAVRVKVGLLSERVLFNELGFADGRACDKPNARWNLLIAIAEPGDLCWKSPAASTNRGAIKKAIHDIRTCLRAFFGIEDDPFYEYAKREGWRPKFGLFPNLNKRQRYR